MGVGGWGPLPCKSDCLERGSREGASLPQPLAFGKKRGTKGVSGPPSWPSSPAYTVPGVAWWGRRGQGAARGISAGPPATGRGAGPQVAGAGPESGARLPLSASPARDLRCHRRAGGARGARARPHRPALWSGRAPPARVEQRSRGKMGRGEAVAPGPGFELNLQRLGRTHHLHRAPWPASRHEPLRSAPAPSPASAWR